MENLGRYVGILKHDKVGYAEEILVELLRVSGFVASIVDPRDIVFGIDSNKFPNVVIARCELSALCDPVLVAYITYLRECVARSIPVINSEYFLMSGQEKYLTHLAVHDEIMRRGDNDVINPRTYLVYDRERAYSLGVNEITKNGSVVLKLSGAGRGDGVFLVRDCHELRDFLCKHFSDGKPILIQQTIEKERNQFGGYRDIRVLACRNSFNGEACVVGAYYRNSPKGQFLTNVGRGGFITPIGKIGDELLHHSQLIMDATKGDVAGIDFARDVNGHLWFEEINIAFETSRRTIEIMGRNIWGRVVDLIVSAVTWK